jgi:hypothetical protein
VDAERGRLKQPRVVLVLLVVTKKHGLFEVRMGWRSTLGRFFHSVSRIPLKECRSGNEYKKEGIENWLTLRVSASEEIWLSGSLQNNAFRNTSTGP